MREVVRGMRRVWGEVKRERGWKREMRKVCGWGGEEMRREKGKMGGQEGEHRCRKRREKMRGEEGEGGGEEKGEAL